MSSISDIDEYCTHSTPYKLKNVPMQDSLYMELKVSVSENVYFTSVLFLTRDKLIERIIYH